MNHNAMAKIEALTFDVFGTVVDWRSSVSREIKTMGLRKGFILNWEAFADDWRSGYRPFMDKVRSGKMPWTNIDTLHRMILNDLLIKFEVTDLSEEEKDHLNKAWHRLDPWPDSVAGLALLKKDFMIATLSNGNVSLLIHMAKYGFLPWDTVLSAELVRHYKPDKESYLSTSEFLGVPIEHVMMVAAHKNDLEAANRVGMRTAYVPRPHEYGPHTIIDKTPGSYIDLIADNFTDLHTQLIRIKHSVADQTQ